MGKRRLLESEDEYSERDDHASDDQSYASPRPRSRGNPPQKKTRHVDSVANSKNVNLHPKSLHAIKSPEAIRTALLRWYAEVHETRGMPWRKPYDPSLGPDERAQRAYEVWVSEIMLQQTQVVTVVPYYKRWMEKFPTMRDLAAATIDDVNTLWKGLGYYKRASRLLAGAQQAVQDYGGKLPNNAKDMEIKIPGIGRYTAGAICSIAYGERVPVLDGNVHRLLSRFLALHALPKAKSTLDILWAAATAMVQSEDSVSRLADSSDLSASHMASTQYPGDINQGLIELGSTVCKVHDPDCGNCPLSDWCGAYTASLKTHQIESDEILDIEDMCTLCEPLEGSSNVTAYPMKVERKKVREELDIVNVIEWRSESVNPEQRWFLLVRRPEEGLLAGLHEFPTSENVSKTPSRALLNKLPDELLSRLLQSRVKPYNPGGSGTKCNVVSGEGIDMPRIKKVLPAGDIVHVFSHIKKTYRVQWVVLEGGVTPPDLILHPNSPAEKSAKRRSKKLRDADMNEDSKSTLSVTGAAMWILLDEVANANMGTGVVKVWNLAKKLWEDRVSARE